MYVVSNFVLNVVPNLVRFFVINQFLRLSLQSIQSHAIARLACALMLGALHAASFAPLSAWFLQALTLGGLWLLLGQTSSIKQAAQIGLLFGLGWFLSGISWVYISLHIYGQMPFWVAAPATFLLCAVLALYPALVAVVWQRWVKLLYAQPQGQDSCALTAASTRAIVEQAILFGGLWSASEWLRGTLFTGFPWLNTGYAHAASPLAGYAPIVGVYGLAWLSASMAVLCMTLAVHLYQAEHGETRWAAWSAVLRQPVAALCWKVTGGLLLLGALLTFIPWTSAHQNPIAVRLLQGGIPQDMKFRSDQLNTAFSTYFGLIEDHPADLIVLPETAFPLFWHEFPIELKNRLQRYANAYQSHIVTGVPLEEPRGHYTNSAVQIAPGGRIGTGQFTARYDKQHLVPFGEFIPFGFRWFVNLMNMPLGDFGRGELAQTPFQVGEQRVAMNVCYEDLFGEELRHSGRAATILVNVSNLAWFGDSFALPQHLQIAQMRALEMRKPMLRATNTGMTAIVQANGKVTQQLTPFITGSAEGMVQGRSGSTPYAWWGNWLFLAACCALLYALVQRHRALK